MKRNIITILIIFSIYIVIGFKANGVVIPDDAIRLRVIPNSNSDYDQRVKLKVKEKLQTSLYNLLKDTKGSSEARKKIVENLPIIDSNVKEVLKNEKYNYDISYGMHYFPSKEFMGVTYKEGNYESLLVTLGKGKGDNWWCVLFPPLCMIEASSTSSDDINYSSFIKELIDKYL